MYFTARFMQRCMTCFVTAASAAAAPEVAIDVGHSLTAPGAQAASGEYEFFFNRRQAGQLEQALQQQGIRTRLIGANDAMSRLTDRTAAAAGTRLLVSVHHDSVQAQYLSDSGRFRGYSIFISHANAYPAQSLYCARTVARALQASGETPALYHAEPVAGENRPFADRALGIYWYDGLVVLKTATEPALLIEHGVIANPLEEARLKQPGESSRLAHAVADGIRHCLPALPAPAAQR